MWFHEQPGLFLVGLHWIPVGLSVKETPAQGDAGTEPERFFVSSHIAAPTCQVQLLHGAWGNGPCRGVATSDKRQATEKCLV